MSATSTRTKILDAAREQLIRAGPAQLTLRGIASEAGVALGNLQYHFATLPLLVEALLARELEAGRERLASALGAAQGVPLARVVDVLLDDHDDEPLVRLFIGVWSLAAIEPRLRPQLHAFYDVWANLVTGALVELGVPRREAGIRARLFIACLEGFSLFRSGVASRPDGVPRRRARELLVRVLEGDRT